MRKTVIFIADSLDNAHKFQQVLNFACEELVLIHGSTSFLFPLTGDGRLRSERNLAYAAGAQEGRHQGFHPLIFSPFLRGHGGCSELRL